MLIDSYNNNGLQKYKIFSIPDKIGNQKHLQVSWPAIWNTLSIIFNLCWKRNTAMINWIRRFWCWIQLQKEGQIFKSIVENKSSASRYNKSRIISNYLTIKTIKDIFTWLVSDNVTVWKHKNGLAEFFFIQILEILDYCIEVFRTCSGQHRAIELNYFRWMVTGLRVDLKPYGVNQVAVQQWWQPGQQFRSCNTWLQLFIVNKETIFAN